MFKPLYEFNEFMESFIARRCEYKPFYCGGREMEPNNVFVGYFFLEDRWLKVLQFSQICVTE